MKSIFNLFNKFPEIELANYHLRALTVLDWQDICEIYGDQETLKFEAINCFKSKSQALDFINTVLVGYKNKFFIRWAIEDKLSKKVIGLVAIHHIDYRNYNAQIGYILNKDYWHKGIMSLVLNELISYLFKNTSLHRLEVRIHPENHASLKLAKRLGFSYEGDIKESGYNELTKQFENRVLMGLIKQV